MKFSCFIAICCLHLVTFRAFGQYPMKFTLVVNYKSETNETLHISESYYLKQYRAATFVNDTAIAINKQYFFKGELLYPTAIRVFNLNEKVKFNELIFIDSGYQEIELIKQDTLISMSIVSPTEIEKEHRKFVSEVGVSDLDREIFFEPFELYIRNNPKSYVALFALISQVFNYDFSPEFKKISTYFDSSLQATKGYEYFAIQYLKNKKIPNLIVRNSKQENVTLNFNRADGKYTLVEFWFTGCTGCIPNMLSLKKNYKNLSNNVKIITVCTDTKTLVPQSLKLMKKLNLPWKNYWDYKARQFEKHTLLYMYPGNILIDNNGYIVGKDIDISRVQDFLPTVN
jgi:Redoxin